MNDQPELQNALSSPRRRRVRLACLAGLAALILAAAVGAYLRRVPAPEPPVVDLQGAEPTVAAAIEEARAAVKRARASSDSWGRLGMVLLAHQFWEDAL